MQQHSSHSDIKILHVEDSEDDAELMFFALKSDGFSPYIERVSDHKSMQQALCRQWDIVISDFAMPQFSAFDALEILRASNCHAPFIVVSGAIGEETAVALIKAGAHDFVMKDQLQRLGRTIRRELAETRSRLERQRAEQALRESDERYRATVDAASDAIVTFNHGKILMANRAVERIFGHEPAELTGQLLTTIIPDPGDIEADSDPGTSVEGRHRDGRRIALEITYGRVMLHGTQVFTAVVRDVTERKQAEIERERLYEETMQASRLKDEFLATLSHELRTPLYVIAGHAELLALEDHDSLEFKESLEAIRKYAKIQTQLINDLLDVSGFITGKFALRVRPVNLSSSIEAAIGAIQFAAHTKGIHLTVNLEGGAVAGDPDRLQQVFWNLLSNAVKFTPPGGQVRVAMLRRSTRAVVEVSDTGIGIEPRFLPYVFERFKQEDSSNTRAYGGLGLGLSIVRHIVEMHGGSVEVFSSGKDQGTTFTVTLPLAGLATFPEVSRTRVVNEGSKKSAQKAWHSLQSKRILVVDNKPETLRLISKILIKAGAVVKIAESQKEAHSRLIKDRFDALICDIGLPEDDAFVLIREIRRGDMGQHLNALPSIALTAYTAEADRLLALVEGFDDHLGKPILPSILIERLAALIEP